MDMKANLTWTDFYMELADKFLLYKDNRKALIEKIRTIYTTINMTLPKLEADDDILDIDPFTVFGLFNKGITDDNRISLLKGFAKEFSVEKTVPESLAGIPVLNNLKATFYWFKGERQEHDIDNLWNVFIAALEYASNHSEINKKNFIEAYDMVLNQKGVKWNITMGLYWIRPYEFVNLDSVNREYLCKSGDMPVEFTKKYGALKNVPSGNEYIDIIDRIDTDIKNDNHSYKSFPELSHYAFMCSQKTGAEKPSDENDSKAKIVENKNMLKYPKNLILYGPPGTGKTYNAVNYAVGIIENKTIETIRDEVRKEVLARYNKYRDNGLIEFCTFHQSFGYEEFIEGIKPKVDEEGTVLYKVEDGCFKAFCEKPPVVKSMGIKENPDVWKIVLSKTSENDIKTECFKNDHIRIGYGDDKTFDEIINENDNGVVKDFVENMAVGDFVVVHCYPNSFDAIGVITGEFRKNDSFSEFQQVRDVNWLLKDGKVRSVDTICTKFDTRATIAKISTADVNAILKLIETYGDIPKKEVKNKVFIIDEINRGNISKVFGELITLIEDTKRIGADEEMCARLPYSGKKFGVPSNVYILGTMNTADRSIALIDTALRRRFKFEEMQPDPALLEDVVVDGVNVQALLEMLNKRIEVLYDREHTIGHSFFMDLNNKSTIYDLAEIFEHNVIPLLKEYFYDEYERIAAVLGDDLNQNDEESDFILRQDNDYAKIKNPDIAVMTAYKFNRKALYNPKAYTKIYED